MDDGLDEHGKLAGIRVLARIAAALDKPLEQLQIRREEFMEFVSEVNSFN
ncbi:MAG: hypothetical protein QMC95_05725 [Desulfitobacteriaceae bacterium]|nr:hypothetical protein [Desulfitobacteriaceae bacterium]MDI6880913.1 hypothetical protein [Desulfitobacteriaceae bacterium]MDI6913701.1 hypothetical protein [Desulfitobacteriaceae bacterium]